MGDRPPIMTLMPDIILQPKGVTEAAASPALDAASMPLIPAPATIHQPKMAKVAMGMVNPLTVKR